MMDRKRLLHSLPRLATMLLVLAGFAAGFALGQGSRPVAAQEATPEATAEPETTGTPEPPRVIPAEDHEALYPIWQTYDIIRRGYRSPTGEGVSANGIIEAALEGMVARLGDPNSYYIPAAQLAAFENRVAAQTVGIGITVGTNQDNGDVYVTRVIDLSPAAEAGLMAGDIIVGMDGEDVSELAQPAIVELARGEEGSQLVMTVERDGVRLDFPMVRSVINRPVINSEIIGDIGYIRLDQFAPNARGEMDAALATFAEAGITGLIFDVRNNAGGTSGATVAIASAFIPEGRIFTEDFGSRERVFEVNGDLADISVPLVILVNERSQSASEALAGAIQDYDLGTIIGVPTFGKGTVQTVSELTNGGAVRFTIARVLTPSGDTYHAVGVQPDIVVEATDGPEDAQLDAALTFLRELADPPELTPEATTEAD